LDVKEQVLDFWGVQNYDEATRKITGASKDVEWDRRATFDIELILDEHVKSTFGGTAVEIGCGPGRLMKPMSGYFWKVIGLDAVPIMKDHASVYLNEDADVRLIEDRVFPLEDDEVDLVYSFTVFQHIHDLETIEKYVAEAHRVLKVGGIIRIQTRNGLPPQPGQFRGYRGYQFDSVETFATLFEKVGFTVINKEMGLGHKEWLWVSAQK